MKTIYKTTSMSSLDNRKKPNTLIHLSDNDEDDEDSSPPPAKQIKLSTEPKKNPKTIKKTNSASAKLFPSQSSSSTQSTTISTLLGIVDSPKKINSLPSASLRTLPPNTFDIILCIDNAEASRSTQKVLLEHLKKNSIRYDVRKVNIGDFLWLVQRKLFDSTHSSRSFLSFF